MEIILSLIMRFSRQYRFSLLLLLALHHRAVGQVTYLSDWDPPGRGAPPPARIQRQAAPAQPPASRRAAVPVAMRPAPPPYGYAPPRAPSPAVPAPQRMRAVVAECWRLARQGLSYQFGSMDPSSGGLDCSGTVKYLLDRHGWPRVPRTASDQYVWLQQNGLLQQTSRSTDPGSILGRLRPGDLLFWRGTYVTNRWPDVSHVMIYLGRDSRTGMHQMFGASSSKRRGLHGSQVDVYEFNPAKPGRSEFIGFGSIPSSGS